MRSPGFLAVMLLGTGAHAAGPTLESVRAQVNDLQFSAAGKALAQLGRSEGFSRAESLEFFTLEGLVKGALNDAAGAKKSFTRALLIDPELKLPTGLAPRVTTPFLEAKASVKESGGHALRPPTQRRVGEGWELEFQPPVDPSGVMELIVFTCVEDGVSRDVELTSKSVAKVRLEGFQVSVSWKLVGARGWVLHDGGAFSLERPKPVTKVEVQAAPAPLVTVSKEAAPRKLSPALGIVSVSLGTLAAGLGGIVLFSTIGSASRAREAMTYAELQAALSTGRTSQAVAAVLLTVGGVLSAGGIALIVWSLTPSKSVSFVPTSGGGVMVLQGAF